MQSLEVQLTVPDFWQQQAIQALKSGKDVVLSAPTGAGKTYVFEQFVENGFSGRAIYTVPTRALANDKRLEWAHRGWKVGIATGDRAENLEAPIIVATLETQKNRLLQGIGPDLLVIDEYQMIGDPQRGLNYELSLAAAPAATQLLLMSGSVGNPQDVVKWLRKLGRPCECIHHSDRPVPLEEIQIEALPNRIPSSVRGFWPRAVARVLKAEMAPLLAFAPRRKAAEILASQIARMLPEEDPLILTPEQQRIAGDELKRLLKARVAYHHSGLDYAQRAGLVEPLAKAGQLRVVVATMGLASGINFSMRSVLVTDREYRSGEQTHRVRPDELLQMFGRAGRRGMDKIGYITVAPGKPRLAEARPLQLQRTGDLDWPSIIRVMQQAIVRNEDALAAARDLTGRLFAGSPLKMGLGQFKATGPNVCVISNRRFTQEVVEIQTPDGDWERKRAARLLPLKKILANVEGSWMPALRWKACLENVKAGLPCKLDRNGDTQYGREVPIARVGTDQENSEMVLTRWTTRQIRSRNPKPRKFSRFNWTLDRIENRILPMLPELTSGGRFSQWRERNNVFYALLDYSNAKAYAYVDAKGRGLLNPPERKVAHVADLALASEESAAATAATPADAWFQLGLIDAHAAPTRRGILFSFFNYGEGLAIAAALEDPSYDIEELIVHIANIRAGHRFSDHELSSGRLGMVCRSTYRDATFPGYLQKGLPPTYGDGAAEILQMPRHKLSNRRLSEELRSGDIERARLEWHSLVRHIAAAPDLNWDRWLDFKALAIDFTQRMPKPMSPDELPPLTSTQQQRHKSFLRFGDAV